MIIFSMIEGNIRLVGSAITGHHDRPAPLRIKTNPGSAVFLFNRNIQYIKQSIETAIIHSTYWHLNQ